MTVSINVHIYNGDAKANADVRITYYIFVHNSNSSTASCPKEYGVERVQTFHPKEINAKSKAIIN
jgi:hypothetical protein